MSEREWFSVPYRIAKDGTPLVATVYLEQQLRRGALVKIARQIAAISVLAEQPIKDAESTSL